MRQRNWTFYKVVLYLGLVTAIGIFVGLFYSTFFGYTSEWKELWTQLSLTAAMLQTLFYIFCIRLVHHYIPNRLKPGPPFNMAHISLLVFNSCIALYALYILAIYFSEVFFRAKTAPGLINYKVLLTMGSYTFVTIYLSATTIVLRRYNRYQVAIDEEKWLQQLGNHSLNE